MTLSEILKNINETKDLSLLKEQDKDYLPFIVNRCLSMHMDAILHVNTLNMRPNMPKRMQHDFLVVSLRARKRFAKLPKKTENSFVQAIQEYFNISEEKAKDLVPILQGMEEEICNYLSTGGISDTK